MHERDLPKAVHAGASRLRTSPKTMGHLYIFLAIMALLIISLFFGPSLAATRSDVTLQSTGTIRSATANLAVIPDDWDVYDNAPSSWTAIAHLDYSVTHNGHVSIRLDPHTSADTDDTREIDATWYTVKPGDHIVFTAWIKTSASGDPTDIPPTDNIPGGNLGMDFYVHSSAGYGRAYIGPTLWVDQLGEPNNDGQPLGPNDKFIGGNWWVPYGSDWTKIGWDVYVPSNWCSYVFHNALIPCNPVQVDTFVAWFGVRSVTNPAHVWFADAELYINPT